MDRFDESTRWGTIRKLSDRSDEREWQIAWRHLLDRYRPVLVAYARGLLFRMGGRSLAENESDEVVDGFLAACLEKGWLARADPALGRFRVFIRVLLARYARDWMAHRSARKRTPAGGPPVSLDVSPVASDRSPGCSELMDREWASCMARGAIERVRARSPRNADVLDVLLVDGDPDRERLALQLGRTPHQVPLIIFQARRMMAEELWSELKQTVSNLGELDEERSALRPFLEGYLDRDMAQSFFSLPVGRVFTDPPGEGRPPD